MSMTGQTSSINKVGEKGRVEGSDNISATLLQRSKSLSSIGTQDIKTKIISGTENIKSILERSLSLKMSNGPMIKTEKVKDLDSFKKGIEKVETNSSEVKTETKSDIKTDLKVETKKIEDTSKKIESISSEVKTDKKSDIKKVDLDDLRNKLKAPDKNGLKGKNGINDFLFNPEKATFFEAFCKKEHSDYNISFMKELKVALNQDTPDKISEKLKELGDKYIGEDSQYEINLPKTTVEMFKNAINQPPEKRDFSKILAATDDLNNQMNINLDDTFKRFINAKPEKKETGGLSNIFGKKEELNTFQMIAKKDNDKVFGPIKNLSPDKKLVELYKIIENTDPGDRIYQKAQIEKGELYILPKIKNLPPEKQIEFLDKMMSNSDDPYNDGNYKVASKEKDKIQTEMLEKIKTLPPDKQLVALDKIMENSSQAVFNLTAKQKIGVIDNLPPDKQLVALDKIINNSTDSNVQKMATDKKLPALDKVISLTDGKLREDFVEQKWQILAGNINSLSDKTQLIEFDKIASNEKEAPEIRNHADKKLETVLNKIANGCTAKNLNDELKDLSPVMKNAVLDKILITSQDADLKKLASGIKLTDNLNTTGTPSNILNDSGISDPFGSFLGKSDKQSFDYLKDVKKISENPDLNSIQNLYDKYLKSDSTPAIEVSDQDRKAIEDALKNGDLGAALQGLNNSVTTVNNDLKPQIKNFLEDDMYKNYDEILKPVTSLPEIKQLGAMNKVIAENKYGEGQFAKEIGLMELNNKYCPNINLESNKSDELKKCGENFKQVLSSTVPNTVGNKLDNFLNAYNNIKFSDKFATDLNDLDQKYSKRNITGEGQKEYDKEAGPILKERRNVQLPLINKALVELNKFSRENKLDSDQTLLVDAMKEKLTQAKQKLNGETGDSMEAQERKGVSLNNGVEKIMTGIKTDPNNFNKSLDLVKGKAGDLIKKDPHGDLAWAVSTLDKEKAIDKIYSTLLKDNKGLEPKQINQMAEKIYAGMKENLPIQSNSKDSKDSIVINGEKYIDMGPLGKQGAMGSVHKYQNKDGKCVVVKSFKNYDDFSKEAEGHRMASGNKNVTKLEGAFFNEKTKEFSAVQEFVDGGDLNDFLKDVNKYSDNNMLSFSDAILVRQYLARGFVDGMIHVNEKADVMHSDIKPDNIFIDKKTGDIKIGDFGLSDKNKEKKLEGGSPVYMAPEVIRNRNILDSQKTMVDKSSDIWSGGVVIDEIMSGKNYVHTTETESDIKDVMDNKEKSGENIKQAVKETKLVDDKGNVIREEKKVDDPSAMGKALNKMMKFDKNDRMKFSELRQQDFFTDPIGSDERAQKLIKAIYEVEQKKKNFKGPGTFDEKAEFNKLKKEFSNLV
jgi:serine/threonine protein kinase